MVRSLYLLFGAAAYLIFFGTFLYLIAFVGDLPWVPRTIDRPESGFGLGGAVATDLALVALFGLQHSVMARQGFKAAWTRIVPEPVERSFYVLFASLALIAMFLFWQPLPGVVWSLGSEAARILLWALFGAGWLIVLVSTLLISHFELFGLKQVWAHMRGAPAEPPVFRQPFLYKLVRHPIYSGFFIAFWATPEMSVGHLLFAVAMSAYMLIAISYEERDLIRLFGKDYEQYRTNVGKLTPRLMRRG
ncbi:MAG TPA: isoprenylcysteine carboxylmethyltransferase family protein [Allosphingosinicella sp.]|nr:isoprenylcysteine carboxylmethyltransferase family protein [Allosphingosinicella sp.]